MIKHLGLDDSFGFSDLIVALIIASEIASDCRSLFTTCYPLFTLELQ